MNHYQSGKLWGTFSEKGDEPPVGWRPKEVKTTVKHAKWLVVGVLLAAIVGTAGIVAASSLTAEERIGTVHAAALEDDDGDGIRNWADVDYALPILLKDSDGDGVPNGEDPDWVLPEGLRDDDSDGIRNAGDVDWIPPFLEQDADGDGIPNAEDPDFVLPAHLGDDDGDGIRNWADADYPLEALGYPLFGFGPHRFGGRGQCGA